MVVPTKERKERKVCRGGHWPPEWKAYEEKKRVRRGDSELFCE